MVQKSGRSFRLETGVSSLSGRGLFLLFGLFFLLRPAFAPGQTPEFWEVGLKIQVEGSYFCRQDGRRFEGIFHGSFRWEGLMEPDEPDVILYHWRTEVLSWEAKEKEADAPVNSGFRPIASNPPELMVSTFLRHGDSFDLHFFINSLAVPLSAFQPRYRLILPASFGQDLRTEGLCYNDYVCHGSNRVAVAAKELLTRGTEQTISWSWRFPPDHLTKGGQELRMEHRVKVELVTKPRFKSGAEASR